MSYAFSGWLLPDDTVTTSILTTEEYEKFAIEGEGRGDAPGRPSDDAEFVFAGNGVPDDEEPEWWYSRTAAKEPEKAQLISKALRLVRDVAGNDYLLEVSLDQIEALDGIVDVSVADFLRVASSGSVERRTAAILNHKSVTFELATSGSGNPTTGFSVPHTTGGNPNSYITSMFTIRGGTMTSVAYNGDALTARQDTTNDANGVSSHLYELVNPDAGVNLNMVYVCTSSTLIAGTISAYGVDQTTPRSNFTTKNGGAASTAPTIDCTSGGTDELVITLLSSSAALTLDGTFTADWNLTQSTRVGSGAHKIGSAGTVTRTDASASSVYTGVAASLKAATAGGTSLFRPANLSLGAGGPFFSNPVT